MKKGLIIIIAAVLVIAGVAIAGFSLGWFSGGQKAEEVQKTVKELTFSLGDFTVNLNEPNYKRYIMVKLTAGYTKEGLDVELTEKLPKMSDIINSVLRSKKIEDINTPEKTDAMKNEIKDKINEILGEDKLTNIYLNKILIQ